MIICHAIYVEYSDIGFSSKPTIERQIGQGQNTQLQYKMHCLYRLLNTPMHASFAQYEHSVLTRLRLQFTVQPCMVFLYQQCQANHFKCNLWSYITIYMCMQLYKLYIYNIYRAILEGVIGFHSNSLVYNHSYQRYNYK